MSYQSTENFRDLRFPHVFVTVCTGNDVLPFPFMNRNVIIWRFQLNGRLLLLIRVLHAFVIRCSKSCFFWSLYRISHPRIDLASGYDNRNIGIVSRRHGWIPCWTLSFLLIGFREYKSCSIQLSLVRVIEHSLRCSRVHLWWLLVHWDKYQRPLLKWRVAPVSWLLFPLPWRFSFRLALLLRLPR